MKKLLLVTAYVLLFSAAAMASPLDSLKQKLQVAPNDTVKAQIYAQLANYYLGAINANNIYTRRISQENAINYTMLGMHLYYKQNDTTGLINSYSSLSKAYRAQRKFAQAKWFILQANTLSRRQKATPSVINSLVDLAEIKIDIKDYKLAKKDLKEAHRLAMANNLADQDSVVKLSYTRLYTFIQVPPEENVFQGLDESIKVEEAAYAARQKKLAIAAAKLAAKKQPAAKKKMYAVVAAKKRPAAIKAIMPAVNWETPQNSATDSLKTVTSL